MIWGEMVRSETECLAQIKVLGLSHVSSMLSGTVSDWIRLFCFCYVSNSGHVLFFLLLNGPDDHCFKTVGTK